MLTAQGLLGDDSIPDEERRKAQQERLQKLYHNTQVLLSHYRDIAWALECFPEAVAQELEEPFGKLDTLLDRMDAEAGMGNRKLESRVESLRKSRLLLDRFEALNSQREATILMVTHSVKAASHAGRVLFLRDGQVYHQLYRGGESQEAQFRRISDTLTVLAGGGEPHA